VANGEALEARIAFQEFGDVLGYGIVDVFDQAFINGNAGEQGRNGL